MKSIFKKLFWYSAPFTLFLMGFFLAFFFFPRRHVTVSSLIGKRAECAFAELSESWLVGRCVLTTVENSALAGVVIDQLPEAGARVYRGQAIQLTVGQQSIARMIPDFIGQSVSMVKNMAKERGYEVSLVWLSHYREMGTCFAQTPQPHEVISQAKIICYCSLGQTSHGVMPSLIGLKRLEIEHFAEINNAVVQCVAGKKDSKLHSEGEMVVVDQQPAAGIIIDGSKQLFIQVQLAGNAL